MSLVYGGVCASFDFYCAFRLCCCQVVSLLSNFNWKDFSIRNNGRNMVFKFNRTFTGGLGLFGILSHLCTRIIYTLTFVSFEQKGKTHCREWHRHTSWTPLANLIMFDCRLLRKNRPSFMKIMKYREFGMYVHRSKWRIELEKSLHTHDNQTTYIYVSQWRCCFRISVQD